jgi:hypothetical protein
MSRRATGLGRAAAHRSHMTVPGGMAARRTPLLAALTGQVIDIGAGTGASFGYYPPPSTT